jgi:hypothetical protein
MCHAAKALGGEAQAVDGRFSSSSLELDEE